MKPSRDRGKILGIILAWATLCVIHLAQPFLPPPSRSAKELERIWPQDERWPRSKAQLDQLRLIDAAPTIVIQELMSSNPGVLFDEDRDAPDWIQLLNRSSEAVSLQDWKLADGRDPDSRWTFPELVLEPGESLNVWASGKDRVGSALSIPLWHWMSANFQDSIHVDRTPDSMQIELEAVPDSRTLEIEIEVPRAGDYELWLQLETSSPRNRMLAQVGDQKREFRIPPSSRPRCLRVDQDQGVGGVWKLASGPVTLRLSCLDGTAFVHRVSWSIGTDVDDLNARHVHTNFRLNPSGETLSLIDARE